MENDVLLQGRHACRLLLLCLMLAAAAACGHDAAPVAPTSAVTDTSPSSQPSSVTYTLTGSVKNQKGDGVAGATITVVDTAPNLNAGKHATTDAEGHYMLDGLAFTGFSVSVQASNLAPVTRGISLVAGAEAMALDFVLPPATTTPPPSAPTVHYTVKGIVKNDTGSPVANVKVTVLSANDNVNVGKSATTNSAGAYTLGGLVSGSVSLSVTGTGYQTALRSVQLTAGNDTTSSDFVLTPIVLSYVVRGRVTRQDGTPLIYARVLLTSGPNISRRETTDANGNYAFTALQFASSIRLTVDAGEYQSVERVVPITFGTPVATADFVLTSIPSKITFRNASSGAFSGYTEGGFTVTPTLGTWTIRTGYGYPAPYVGFESAATWIDAALRVVGDGRTFTFTSVDLYSSVTKIPYVITGLLHSSVVFQLTATHDNTFGAFATIANPHSSSKIDTLEIKLTSEALSPSVGGTNPMGVDNIAVSY